MPNVPYCRAIHSYVHRGRIGVLMEYACESDFLLRNPEFQTVVNDVALHIAAAAPEDVDSLYQQPFVRDETKTIAQLLQDASETFREQVQVTRFIRWDNEETQRPTEPLPPRGPAVIMAFPNSGRRSR